MSLPDEVLYDVRLVERHIERGLVSRKEYEKRLSETEDQADQADYLSFAELNGETSEAASEAADVSGETPPPEIVLSADNASDTRVEPTA